MHRRAACLPALMGLLAVWLMLGSPAQAAQPPAPTVTTPSADLIIHESDPAVHFEGTVSGPLDPADNVRVGESNPPGEDIPLCMDSDIDPSGAWSCDLPSQLPIGDHTINVFWVSFVAGEQSPNTVIQMHVIADPPPPPPVTTPPPTVDPPKKHHESTPVVVPPAPAPPPTTEPTPTPEPTPAAVALEPPVEILPGLPFAPDEVAAPLKKWDPTEHPRQVLTLGIATFTILTLIGPTGLAASSMAGVGLAAAAGAAGAAAAAGGGSRKSGSVKAAKVKMTKFSGAGAGRGDRSRTWQLPGWTKADAWSLTVPFWLATRSPLTARVLADGSYLRAIFGTAWTLLVLAGSGLGLIAAHQTDGVPIAPSVALTAALLVLAIFDATAGAAGVAGFLIGMLIWHGNDLSTVTTIRSLLGLAALWFAIPLIAAATRPFRRTTVSGSQYAWDRVADAVIGTLTAGWAVQKTIGGMPGLSGLDLPIADHAGSIAIMAMAAVALRVLVEEFAAWRYPLRLTAVEKGKMPFAGSRQRIFATGLRTVLFVFLSIAFIGNCWQLWVGAVLFLVPQILSIHERKFPNSERLHGLLPGGILKTLVMLIIGSFFAKLVFSILTDPDSMLRNGFILMTIPGLVLSALGLFGHDGPDPKWTWPRQLLGVGVLAAILYLVFTGF